MRSFTTLTLVASAALSTAQVTTNPDGTFTCAIPNAAYCAGTSLSTNIIIRCDGTKGYAGNCDDNLDAEIPEGLSFAPCWQPSATSGEAACSKNCVVYGSSGNYNGTFTLPNCTPEVTPSSSSVVSPTATVTASSMSWKASYTTTVNGYTTVTVPCVSSMSTISSGPTGTGTNPTPSGGSTSSCNGTMTTPSGPTGSATATPVGPSTSSPAPFTGAAAANQAGIALALAGFLIAYLL